MPPYTFRFLLLICLALLLLGVGTSCNPVEKDAPHSQYQVAGTSQLTVVIDSLLADQTTTDNTLYMELMTEKDTFLLRPIEQELKFPQLADSLTQVRIHYKGWYCQIQGTMLREEYQAFYFPDQAATIVLDTFPFEEPKAKGWLRQQKDRLYYEIRFQKDGRFFYTAMTLDKPNTL